ncbi:hypothetical protein TWF173_007009 [Orbilia oligospora]|nr:hypothetical protein TWF173_007009 [Orbilia oligospora]
MICLYGELSHPVIEAIKRMLYYFANLRPQVIILPVDLQYFLDVEEQSGVAYRPPAYLREDILGTRRHSIPRGKYDKPRIWHGSPTAIIVHALQALAHVDDTKWISKETLDTLYAIARARRRELLLGGNGVVLQAGSQAQSPYLEASDSVFTRTFLSKQESGRKPESRTGMNDTSSAAYYDESLDSSSWELGLSFTANQALRIFCRNP